MQLGTKGRYGVMAMIHLKLHQDVTEKTQPVPLSHIAQEQEISVQYLEQIFSKLRRAGLVSSVRGVSGGYVLARAAGEISVADIISAVGEPIHVTRCAPHSKGKGCMRNREQCMTHHLWADLTQKIHTYLCSISLEDVGKPSAQNFNINALVAE